MKLIKKNIIRLLNDTYRSSVLKSFKANTPAKEKLDEEMSIYAKLIINQQRSEQNPIFANDPKSNYGLSPISFICAIKKDGSISKILLEMQQINHFLRIQDLVSAVEVMKCILVMWVTNEKDICSFNLDLIEAELKKIESKNIEQDPSDDSNKSASSR